MATIRLKLIAVTEVVVAVVVASFIFRRLDISPLRQWELGLLGGQKFYFMEYAAVLVLALCLIALSRRGFDAFGIRFKNPKYLFTVVAVALIPFLILGATLSFVNWRQWTGALVVSLVTLGNLVIIALLLRKTPMPGEVLVMGIFVVLTPNALFWLDNLLGPTIVRTLYIYLLVGPTEEILFRGYVQSRLNMVWGRPYSFFGVRWGLGIIFASMLFGLWHVLIMPSTPGVWLQVFWTTFAGLTLGYIREKSESIIPSSILHSVMNYVPFTELLGS